MPSTIEKPAGCPVFPPHADPDGDCCLRDLLDAEPARRDLAFPEGFAGGIAHRLDVHTSGALLVADDPAELALIREAFAEKRFVKTYRMRAAKAVPWSENRCDRAIAHDRKKRKRMVVQRSSGTPHRGKWYPAHTQFRRVRDDLFEVTITTGVMHQIRVHAAFLGIPILGDRLYGGGGDGAFHLHHVGLRGPFETSPVSCPEWARDRP